MKKNLFAILMIMLLMSAPGFTEKLATLPDLSKPTILAMDDTQFYVTEVASVYIYSLEDFKLKKKFGKQGEGPQEFKLMGEFGLMVMPQEDHLLINSIGRLSYFTKEGEYIKERNVKGAFTPGFHQPLGKGFVGLGNARDQDSQSFFTTINLYDENLKKTKEIYRQESFKGGRFEFPQPTPFFYAIENKIIMGGEKEFVINILDAEANKTHSIKRDYKRVKVTEQYKERVHHLFKTHPLYKQGYEQIKKMIKFPDYFPAILIHYVDNNKIYIVTYLEENEKYETFIYNTDGKFIKRVFLPIKYISVVQSNPLAFKDNKLYELIENEETEEWEMHAFPIE
ncbi:MAG: hypothetical protein KAW12_03305 [Candidatus Aminicenantes bacterium]|nr:hypothetical protein [Candidatus Aminicenantes bacterium]